MKLLSRCRIALKTFGAESRRDDGVIGLVIVIALLAAAAALIATTARQNKDAEVRRLSGNATAVSLLKDSVVSYFLTGTSGTAARRIPCPDTDLPPNGSGEDDETSGVCNSNVGVVPWLDLRLSQDDVVDTYGNYFTYAITGNTTARGVCTSIANSYATSLTEYTGTVVAVSDTEVRLTSQSAGQGSPYYYAFISHGKNGLGAISQSGSARSAPTSSSETENYCAAGTNCTNASSLVLFSGPRNTETSTYFDDTVYLGSRTQLTDLCESQTPAQRPNAEVNESFNSTTAGSVPASITAARSTVNVQLASGSTTDRVLLFAGTSAAVATAVNYNTAERARYVSFEWRPIALSSQNEIGISIGLRATAAHLNSGTEEDIFNDTPPATDVDGLTIRFYEDTSGAGGNQGTDANRIYICDDTTSACDTGSNLAQSGMFTLTLNTTYTVEAYDDGEQVWGRISQGGTVLATVARTTALPVAQQDFGDSNQILIINHDTSDSEVDDLLVGRGSMAVTFDGTDDVIETAGDSHDTTTGNLTLEAWVKADTLPTGSARATFVSKWIHNGASNAAQAYRFYMTSSGLALDVAGDDAAGGVNIVTQTHTFGYKLTTSIWTHLAVTYNETGQVASLYVNGEPSTSTSATTFDANGVNNGSARFSVAAERDDTSAYVNELDGDITDVRVWDTVRSASEVFLNYNRRIPIAGTATGLVANWTLDRETTATLPTFGGTAANTTTASGAGASGTLTNNATYIAMLQRYLPVFSTSFCTTGTIVGPYQCEYRTTSQSNVVTVPNTLSAVHVKAWGGGGGGYEFSTFDSTGGGGGYSAGRLRTINSTLVSNQSVSVDVGGGGAASGDDNNGAGGGGASGIWLDATPDSAGVIGGGGGGASFGDDNFGGGFNCNGVDDCGPGGGGGGPANVVGLTSVTTTQAVDSGGGSNCGGRGGDNTPSGANPPDASDCESGGTDPIMNAGGTGGGSASGGASLAGAGGAGFNGTSPEIGAGGGGGGVRLSAMTSGGGEAGGYDLSGAGQATTTDTNGSGFGGGGGSGFADTAATGPYGAAGSVQVAGGASDPDYAGNDVRIVSGTLTTTAYCAASGTPCTNTPGRGGEPGSATLRAGKPGAVILKW
jgi:hypothetical protein